MFNEKYNVLLMKEKNIIICFIGVLIIIGIIIKKINIHEGLSWIAETNYDYNGNVIGSGIGTLEEAKAKCASDPTCKGFNWSSSNGFYNYKNELSTRRDYTGGTFYTKVIPTTTPVTTVTTTFRPTDPPPPTLETTDSMRIKEGIVFPRDSIKTINYILNDEILTNQKKVNMVKQFGISSSTETMFYNILFNTLYSDEQKVATLLEYIENKYTIRECSISSTRPPSTGPPL
jgi:hypothetical protein